MVRSQNSKKGNSGNISDNISNIDKGLYLHYVEVKMPDSWARGISEKVVNLII